MQFQSLESTYPSIINLTRKVRLHEETLKIYINQTSMYKVDIRKSNICAL